MMRLKLRLLVRGQNVEDLRHHLRVRDFQVNLDLRAGFGCRSKCCFIERARRDVALLIMERAHLIEQSLIALAGALLNLLNLRFLIVSQIQLATEWSERSEIMTRPTWSATKPRPAGPTRSHRPLTHRTTRGRSRL